MGDNKEIKFWGDLDAVTKLLYGVAKSYRQLWNDGECRLTDVDMKRMGKALEAITKQVASVDIVNKKFEAIQGTEDNHIPEPEDDLSSFIRTDVKPKPPVA